jgi:acetoin utilization protein AcuB
MGIDYEGYIKAKMQQNPVTVGPDASYYEARAIIRDLGIHHLPVVDRHNFVLGLVTAMDLRKAAPSAATTLSVQEIHYLLRRLRVSSFMTPKEKLITITPETLVEEAAKLMRDHKIRCLPVVKRGKLLGIITETDLLDLFVDLFGLNEKGSRLTVAFEDVPGAMQGILEVIKGHDVNVVNLVSPSYKVDGKRIATIRIQSYECQGIVGELEQRGYAVLSTDK